MNKSSSSEPHAAFFSAFRNAFITVALLAVALNAGNAEAQTATLTVPGDVILVQGTRYVDKGGQCINIVYGQWPHVADATSAAFNYKGSNGGSDGAKGASAPKYHNDGKEESAGSAGYPAAPVGFDRIELGFNSLAGGFETREQFLQACNDLAANLTKLFGPKGTADLTVPAPDPAVITSLKGTVSLGSKRKAVLGKVACPAGGTCTVTAPATVKVKIGKKKYDLTVSAPTPVAGGASNEVSVTFPKAAANALVGRTVTVSVDLSTSNRGLTEASGVVKRKVKKNSSK